MALTAQQLQANADYKAGKIDAETYKNLYITKPTVGASTTATASGVKQDFVPKQTSPQTTAPIVPVPEIPMAQEIPQVDYAAQLAQQQQALIEAQKKAQLASLQKAYTSSQGALNQEGTVIPQTYKAARVQADTQFQQQNRRFSDYLAQRGLASSGSAAQGFMNLTGSMQGAKSKANADQANALADLQRRRTDLETGYQFDRQAVDSGAAADLAKYQMDSLYKQQDRYYDQADKADDRKYDETLYNRDKAEQEAANAKQAQLDTLGKYANDYTQGIIDIKGDGDTSNDWLIPYLEAARTQKVAGIESSKANAEAAQYESLMDIWKMYGQAPAGLEAYGIAPGTPTSDYRFKAAQLELDRYKASLSRSGGSGSGGSTGTNNTTSNTSVVDKLSAVTQTEANRQLKQLEETLQSAVENGNPSVALQTLMDNREAIEYLRGPDYYSALEMEIRKAIQEFAVARYR